MRILEDQNTSLADALTMLVSAQELGPIRGFEIIPVNFEDQGPDIGTNTRTANSPDDTEAFSLYVRNVDNESEYLGDFHSFEAAALTLTQLTILMGNHARGEGWLECTCSATEDDDGSYHHATECLLSEC